MPLTHGALHAAIGRFFLAHGTARAWYGRHLDDDWTKWTVDEARALFERFGLTGPTWALPGAAGRF